MQQSNNLTPVGEYGEELSLARTHFQQFVGRLRPGSRVTTLCDSDVDGLGAGVVLWHLLVRRGIATEEGISVFHPAKGENAFTPSTRGVLARSHPRSLFVLDLGVSSKPILHEVPTLFIDHHRPTGEPPGAVAISGYTWEPPPTSSLLTYLLCNSEGEMADKAWVATIGNMGDLGPPYPELEAAARAQKLKWVRAATTLLNAAKRHGSQPVDAAFRLLHSAESAKDVAESNTPEGELLRHCREEVKDALNEVKRLAPRFSKTERVALLEFNSPHRIHPLLAQSWHGRLKGYIVIAANGGFLPDRVSFSTRTSTADNLLEFLARFRASLEGDDAEYGHGHNQAAGGIVSAEAWEKLKTAMGFA